MIDGKRVAQRVKQIMPGQETVTLVVRASDETTTSTPIPGIRRKPATASDLVLMGAVLGETWVNFQFYSPAVVPVVGYRITGADGLTYEVRRVESRMVAQIHTALCLKDK